MDDTAERLAEKLEGLGYRIARPLSLCPFCGGEATIRPFDARQHDDALPPFAVGCFPCRMVFLDDDIEAAIERWNERPLEERAA